MPIPPATAHVFAPLPGTPCVGPEDARRSEAAPPACCSDERHAPDAPEAESCC